MFENLSFLKEALKKRSVYCLIIAVILTACTPSQSQTGNSFEGSDVTPRKGKLSSDFTLEELREIASQTDDNSIEAVEVSAIQTMKTDYKDINQQMLLFEEPVSSDDARFDRLETAVQGIHDNISQITPGINRLLSIEADIRDLHTKLSQMVDEGSMPSTASTNNVSSDSRPAPRRLSLQGGSNQSSETVDEDIDAGATADPIEEEFLPSVNLRPQSEAQEIIQEIQTAPTTSEPTQSTDMTIRAWESAGKTRIVFETPLKEDYTLTFNKSENQVIIETNQAFSADHVNMIEQTSNQIVSTAITQGVAPESQKLTITVKDVNTVSDGYYLPAANADADHRYYFDMFK